MRLGRWISQGLFGGVLALLCLSPGCECSASTSAVCHQPCGEGGMCSVGSVCDQGCCQCVPTAEVCDGRDQDCDTRVDDGLEATCACAPMGRGSHAEECNRIDDDCNTRVDDGLDPAVCPCAPGGAGPGPERCNRVDDDCNGTPDDGLMRCACAPGGPGPSAEVCNDTDDDCNAMVDDGLDTAVCPCAPGGVGPRAETCNGVDDDCDGVIDDGLDAARCACAPGGAGRGPETCNNRDDDCNAMIDDGLAAGTCACAPGGAGPSAETCNAVDDDCNGMVDDGVMLCASGSSACACAPGGPGRGTETCNGVDDDCDGMVDDGLTGCACTGCGAMGGEVCNALDDDCNGTADDGLDPAVCACAPGGAGMSMETCNGVDDDCDGTVDDGVPNCACAPGGAGRGAEVCNGIDDDCDGTIDDGVAACACAPGGAGRGMEICNAIDDDCDTMIDETSVSGGTCGGFGDPCVTNADCSSILCYGDAFARYCTRPCTSLGMSPGDCPAGYRCWDNPSVGGTDLCRRNYSGCTNDASCGAGEVCVGTCDDPGTRAITECRPAIAGGVAAPGACTRSSDCRTNDCFGTGICLGVCGGDSDCAAGYRCVLVGTSMCPGGPVDYVPRCLDACDCDTECPAGQLCQPWVHKEAALVGAPTVGGCDNSYGPLGPDGDCDNTAAPPRFCAHAICSCGGTGYCTQVCSATCGCPSPLMGCGPSTVTFADLGSHPAMTCQTSACP